MTLLEALMQSAPMPGLIRLDGAGDIHMDWELWRQCQERGLEERDLAREERFSAILSAAVTSREGGSRISGRDARFLRETALTIAPEAERYSADVRRPYFRLRGRPVTPDQALEVIRRTDQFFNGFPGDCPGFAPRNGEAPLDTGFLTNWWFHKNHYPATFGWIHPDGTVGIDHIAGIKYPELGEMLEELLSLLRAFPFLDLVLALTDWDEMPPYAWGRMWSKNPYFQDRSPYMEYPDLLDHVVLGFRLGNGAVHVLGPAQARELYIRYVQDFGANDPQVYVPEYYQDRGQTPAGPDYLRRCLEKYGYSPQEAQQAADTYSQLG